MLKAIFSVTRLSPPDLNLSCPSWVARPNSNMMFSICLLIYYLSVSGLTYDIIHSPPAFGVELDHNGNGRPVAILQYQVNQQYLFEGFTAGFMMVISGTGIMILDKTNFITSTRMGYYLLLGLGMFFFIVGPFALYLFFRIKWPGYMEDMFQTNSRGH